MRAARPLVDPLPDSPPSTHHRHPSAWTVESLAGDSRVEAQRAASRRRELDLAAHFDVLGLHEDAGRIMQQIGLNAEPPA